MANEDRPDHDRADHDRADHDRADHDRADHDRADHDTPDHDASGRDRRDLDPAPSGSAGDPAEDPAESQSDGVEVTVLIGTFDALPDRVDALAGILARYVVMTRHRRNCTNVDLVASVLTPGRFTVIEKWRSPDDQRAHMDAPETVAFAEDCRGLLGAPPRFDLCDGISAHDLA